MTIRPLDIQALIEKAGNIYLAIVGMSKRARQLNEDLKIEYNQRIEMLQQSRYSDTEEEIESPRANPDQIDIAKEFERRPKPTEISIREMLDDKLILQYKEETE